jgi:hypothetical protein
METALQPPRRRRRHDPPSYRRGHPPVRYIGLPKTHLAHVLTATALNLIRLEAWWTGSPLRGTRTSHFSNLDFELAA